MLVKQLFKRFHTIFELEDARYCCRELKRLIADGGVRGSAHASSLWDVKALPPNFKIYLECIVPAPAPPPPMKTDSETDTESEPESDCDRESDPDYIPTESESDTETDSEYESESESESDIDTEPEPVGEIKVINKLPSKPSSSDPVTSLYYYVVNHHSNGPELSEALQILNTTIKWKNPRQCISEWSANLTLKQLLKFNPIINELLPADLYMYSSVSEFIATLTPNECRTLAAQEPNGFDAKEMTIAEALAKNRDKPVVCTLIYQKMGYKIHVYNRLKNFIPTLYRKLNELLYDASQLEKPSLSTGFDFHSSQMVLENIINEERSISTYEIKMTPDQYKSIHDKLNVIVHKTKLFQKIFSAYAPLTPS